MRPNTRSPTLSYSMTTLTTLYALELTDREKVYLRRYSEAHPDGYRGAGGIDATDHAERWTCPNMAGWYSHHQNRVYIGDRRIEWVDTPPQIGIPDSGGRSRRPPALADYRNHHRWPTTCHCGRRFTEDDYRQVAIESIYVASGTETTIAEAAAGAVWDAHYLTRKGPDQRSLVVKLPDGTSWPLDYPETVEGDDGATFDWQPTRSGEPPLITVTSGARYSIRNGVLAGGPRDA